MVNDKSTKETAPNAKPAKTQDCPDDFRARPDLDGKNDSGPDPDAHGKELPPQ